MKKQLLIAVLREHEKNYREIRIDSDYSTKKAYASDCRRNNYYVVCILTLEEAKEIQKFDRHPFDFDLSQTEKIIKKYDDETISIIGNATLPELTKEEENALKSGISIENFRISKALQEQEQSEQEQSKPEQKPEEIKVEELNLSIRAYNALKRANIDTIQDFFNLSPEEIKMKVGEKNATETILVLHQMGIEKPESEQEQEQSEQEQEQSEQEQEQECTKKSAFRYKINILEALKKAGYSSARIRKEKLFAQVTLQKFRAGDTNISLQTIEDICNLTELQPWDILDFSSTEAN